MDVSTYVRLRTEIDSASDRTAALSQHGLSPQAWLRIERGFAARAATNAEFRAELAARLANEAFMSGRGAVAS